MPALKLAAAAAASLLALCPALARADSCQGTPGTAKLDLFIDGVRSAKGQVTSSLYGGDKSQFLVKNGALKVWSTPATPPTTHMCIWLKNGPGTYALAAYHDANSNGKWDHNLLGGIEGFGFSNNPHVLFSAPSFDESKFEAKAGVTTLHLRLRYP
jgi:uncharacterized protein (DUF2141 family)